MGLSQSQLQINWNATEAIGPRTFAPSLGSTFVFRDGSGSLKAEKVGKATVTFGSGASSASQLALTGSASGTFTDANGDPITFSKVKAVGFSTGSANASNVTVGGHSADNWAPLLNSAGTLTLPKGTTLAAVTQDADGWAASADNIIHCSGEEDDTLDVFVLGEVS